MEPFDTVNYFSDPDLIPDPYAYFDYLRSKSPVHRFASTLAKALDSDSPFVRVPVGGDARMLLLLNRFVPSKGLHHGMRLALGIPRFGALRNGSTAVNHIQSTD